MKNDEKQAHFDYGFIEKQGQKVVHKNVSQGCNLIKRL